MHLTLVETPTHITPEIKNACKQISKFKPIFVDIYPASWAKVNKCIFNAKQFAEENNAQVILGWEISVWKNVFIECIGHAIILKDNKLIDITPSKYSNSKSLFIQDNNISFDFTNDMSRMPSKMIAISKTKEVRRLIAIEKEIYDIKIKYPVTSHNIVLNHKDGIKITELEKEKQVIIPHIILKHTHHNDLCICGSKKKFRKCCQNKF